MIGGIVLGGIAVFVAIVWYRDRHHPSKPDRRWDDPSQAEAHWAAMLSKIDKGTGSGGGY